MSEIKHTAQSKGKRKIELVKKERNWVSWAQARRQDRFRAGPWSAAGANCTHLITQSMTASWGKAIVLPERVVESDHTNSRCPSLHYPKSRIGLVAVLAIVTSFWRIRCIGNRKEESENESFWSASVQSHSWLAFEKFFSIHWRLSTISSLTLTQSSIHLPFSPSSQNWEKARREWQFWLEGKLIMV